jgi:hypothetical protein
MAACDALIYCGEHIKVQLEVNLGFIFYEKNANVFFFS